MPQVKLPSGGNKFEGCPRYGPITEPTDMYYNMNNAHRGVALILNHKYFEQNLSTRYGTEKDRDYLNTVLTDLGFKVIIKNDLTYNGVYNIIQEIAKLDHSDNDCLVISVMTHGDSGILYSKETHYDVEKLWCNFSDKRCPTLAGKPKLFFIQACRGEKYDDGIKLSNIHIDGATGASNNPVYPDFLLAFSTVPEYYSWRNREYGSWFIQSLCEILAERACDTDILSLMTLVNHRVAVHYESKTPNQVESHGKKEIPSFSSTLTRLLVFTKKKEPQVNCCNHV